MMNPTGVYAKPRVILPIPFSFGAERRDSLRYSQDEYEVDTMRFAGYGTLKLPGYTIQNAILIKGRNITYYQVDSGLVVRNYEVWNWFSQLGWGIPNFSISYGYINPSSGDSLYSYSYFSPLLTKSENEIITDIDVLPNPAINHIQITGLNKPYCNMQIRDIHGRLTA